LALAFSVATGHAQPGENPSANKILEALKARSKLRSPTTAEQPQTTTSEQSQLDKRQRLLKALKAKVPRGLSEEERSQLAALAKDQPSVDLVIYFDLNSAEINAKAMGTLLALGKALSDADLRGMNFLVAGHTDALGSAEYNRALADKRAHAVKQFLVERFRLPESHLLAVGYGEEQLKNYQNPNADENRRVQVVNLGK
jgi:outer membrane protein OmpA-like peptidoglycan-associated protein